MLTWVAEQGNYCFILKKKADRVIGIDRSAKMLEQARHRFSGNGNGIELRIGEIEHLPMRDAEADGAVVNMVLHFLPAPEIGLIEAARVLKKGNVLVIVDIDKHDNEEMRTRYGHRWLGFSESEIGAWLNNAGFVIDDASQYNIQKGLKLNIFRTVRN